MSLNSAAVLWLIIAASFILGNLIGYSEPNRCIASQDVCFHSLNR